MSAQASLRERGRYVEANGLSMYYEEYGGAQPLVLLHRGLATGRIWQPHVSLFAENYRMAAPDGHGHTANPTGQISYRMMAHDIAALTEALGLRERLICGYSEGGNTALELGMRCPGLARALVIGGAFYKPSETLAHYLRGLGIDDSGVVDLERIRRTWPAYVEKWQARQSPQGADHWQSLLRQLSVMWWTPLNYTAEDFPKITAPVLILTGDGDETVPLEETVEMYRLIPGAELAVLPGIDHLATVDRVDLFVPAVSSFFERRLGPSQYLYRRR